MWAHCSWANYFVFICTPLQLPLGVVLAAFLPCLSSPLLSLVAGKVNEMEQNEMYTLAHKYTPTHTHIHTQKHILSKCRPEGPENIRDVSAAVMPKKTVEYSVLCYLVSSKRGRWKKKFPLTFALLEILRVDFLFHSFLSFFWGKFNLTRFENVFFFSCFLSSHWEFTWRKRGDRVGGRCNRCWQKDITYPV